MGVPGLATFVYSERASLLEPYKLRKTTVIIDGNNFANLFFRDYRESKEFVFGGDYDCLYFRVTDFFVTMLKCGITPILVFDGCQPETKFELINCRRRQKLESLINRSMGLKSDPICPLLLFQVLFDGLNEVGIRHRQMYEEADPEIAALAKHLGCPVLSDDSDFFIYDVDVIPFRNMAVKCKIDEDGSLYFPCLLYRSGSMSKLFPGLQKTILPMVDIIFGNSFEGKNFIRVFTESEDRDFRNIFEMLQTVNSREEVIKRILQSLDSEEVEGVERTIRETLGRYDVPLPISLSLVDVETRTTRDGTPSVYGLELSGLPDTFLNFYSSCKLGSFLLGLLRYKRYSLSIPIEDINEDSCHLSSVPIIREIYKILGTLITTPEDITLNMRRKKNLEDVREIFSNQDYTRTAPLRGNVLKEGEDFRRKVFFQSLDLEEMDGERLREFDDDWILFLTSVVYWQRGQRKLRQSHLSAVLLMALCIYVKSMHNRAEGRRRARWSPPRPFTSLVERIPDSEYWEFHVRFNKVRRSDRSILGRSDYFPTIHVFACLQSILYHTIELNNLLGELFREFRIWTFYSGTYLFNLFVLSEDRGFAKEVMEDLPEMRRTYEFLEDSVIYWLRPGRK